MWAGTVSGMADSLEILAADPMRRDAAGSSAGSWRGRRLQSEKIAEEENAAHRSSRRPFVGADRYARGGAGLPDTAGPADRRLPGWRTDRFRGAAARRPRQGRARAKR